MERDDVKLRDDPSVSKVLWRGLVVSFFVVFGP